MYQRFTVNEAVLFLRCPEADIKRLVKSGAINCIQLTPSKVEFFGYQLLEYLLGTVTQHKVQTTQSSNEPDRIIRAKEVQEMTGLSRTTLWRMENKSEFPRRVSLGVGSVGWKLSEVKLWIAKRGHV